MLTQLQHIQKKETDKFQDAWHMYLKSDEYYNLETVLLSKGLSPQLIEALSIQLFSFAWAAATLR